MGSVTIEVQVLAVGRNFVARTELGGIQLRGRRADTAADAVRALLWRLADHTDDDAAIAVDLATDGTTLVDAVAELGAGPGDSGRQ